MTKWTVRFVVVCGCLMAPMAPIVGVSLQAHHSLAGAYALKKEAKITGTFTAFRLVNPHSSLKLEVKNSEGKATEWSITGGSVTSLAKLGVGRDGPNALHVGEEITVTYIPAADGKSPIGLLVAITYSDGHTIRFRSPDE